MSSRSIIIAIDSITKAGFKSNPVVHWTLRHHARQGDKLIFIHATKHLDANTAKNAGYINDANPQQTGEMERNLTETAMELLAAYGSELAASEITVQIIKGDPREVLCKSVESFQANCIVVGSRGVGAVKRVLLGSVSDYLAKNSNATVVIVKA